MTKEQIWARIQEIRDVKADNEKAHAKEDDLYFDFISFVSMRRDVLGEMAKTVLTTKHMDFHRWTSYHGQDG